MCRHCQNGRLSRRTLVVSLAALPLLGACKEQKEGPEEIHWGRETCAICGMIISDPRFAAEIRGGEDRALLKFDDIGDAVHWMSIQPWKDAPETEFWVMDSNTGTDWLDARKAFYHTDAVSPMDYGYRAVPTQEPGTVDFATMYQGALDHGLTLGCLPVEEWKTE